MTRIKKMHFVKFHTTNSISLQTQKYSNIQKILAIKFESIEAINENRVNLVDKVAYYFEIVSSKQWKSMEFYLQITIFAEFPQF